MSHFVFILLVEVILVLFVSLIVLIVFNWKRKKQNDAEIERLLGRIEENEATRKKHLVSYLKDPLGLEEQPAIELVEDFIAAEKRFTHRFLEIQLNQQTVSDFYQYSCEFVDKYLQLIAENVPNGINNDLDITGEASPEDKKDANNSEEIEEKSKENEVKDTEPEIVVPNSKELDSNEAGQTPASDAEPVEDTNNSEGGEDEFSEESDLGDAFAEAGVEMEESIVEKNVEN